MKVENLHKKSIQELISDLSLSVLGIKNIYSSLLGVVVKEKQNILEHELLVFEEVVSEKKKLGELIVKNVENSKELFKVIRIYIENQFDVFYEGRVLSLSDYIRSIEKWMSDKSVVESDFFLSLVSLKDDLNVLKDYLSEIKPTLESNKFIIERLRNNYLQSLAFWQTIAGEVESSYDLRGKKMKTKIGRQVITKA
jgi:hypothetical protein